jgi:glutamyl-Q tRNA(Asp) synthetase
VNDSNIFTEVGDFVLRRADGIYSYQLAVVVDDQLQGITHVVRGSDLEDNTPRQNYLQQQLGYRMPTYTHLPVINNQHGEKLSKQSGALPIEVRTDADVLQVLRDAALHLSLTDAKLYSKTTTISNWLEIAIESAKNDAHEKRINWLQY